jgi:hypothetical protein
VNEDQTIFPQPLTLGVGVKKKKTFLLPLGELEN